MPGVIPPNLYDLSKALQCGLVVLPAMLAQQALHQPGLSVAWFEIDNPVEEDLGSQPPFLADGTGGMTTININCRVICEICMISAIG
jgi:hypothetical protein